MTKLQGNLRNRNSDEKCTNIRSCILDIAWLCLRISTDYFGNSTQDGTFSHGFDSLIIAGDPFFLAEYGLFYVYVKIAKLSKDKRFWRIVFRTRNDQGAPQLGHITMLASWRCRILCNLYIDKNCTCLPLFILASNVDMFYEHVIWMGFWTICVLVCLSFPILQNTT